MYINTTESAAVDYLRRGWSVIRLKGKIPSEPWAEYQGRRMTPEEISEKPWPGVGIVTGVISNLVVLDADSPEAAEELQTRGHPPTPMAKTARGIHLYFKHPGGKLPTKIGLGSGLDLKGDGAYVAAPPSTHPSGASYEWIIPPDDVGLADLPPWATDSIRGEARRTQAADVGEIIANGSRNRTLFSIAGTLRRRGLDEASIAAALLGINATKCEVPLEEDEVRKIAQSASRYEPSENGHFITSSSPDTPPYFSDDEVSEDADEYKIVWFAELGEPKEREYLIEKIGVKGYPIVAFGAGGVAKSFAMLSAGIAIASASGAEEWLGLRVLEHGHVLYLDFELDVEEQHRRVRDLCAGMGIPIPKKLAYLSGVGLSTEAAFGKTLRFVRDHEAVAVIIDSMGLAMQGDMMKDKEVLAFHANYINPLRRAGATPFIVDHEAKLQTGEKHKDKTPFGSAYKAWTSRSVLQFVFEEYREKTSELDIRVRQTKANFGPKIEPIGLRFTFEEKKVTMGGYDLPDEELVDEESRPVKERILAALRLEGATKKQLEQVTGASTGTVSNKLSELRAEGLIDDDGKRPATYFLTSSSPKYTGVCGDDEVSVADF